MLKQLFDWVQMNGEIVLIPAQIISIIVLFVLVHKINKLKNKMEKVLQKTNQYLKFVLEEDTSESENIVSQKELHTKCGMDEEKQNRIIADVLQEMFP